jgi:iron complex outermembrane recepter protein
MKTRLLKTVCTVFLTPTLLFAQQSINGKVTNEKGEPLPGATVVIKESFLGVSTGSSGNYEFTKLPNQTYTLEVKFVGYVTEKKTATVKDADATVNFQLTPDNRVMDEFTTIAVKASDKTPTTYTELDKDAIEKSNFGQDLTYVLDQTPSTVVTSDAGAGVGYTGIRIRGVDPTRTNVTINGIPINDAESHGVWWVNMPDLVSSTGSIQVQRGVGTSTNGAAAFGASINIDAHGKNDSAYAEIGNTFGSFNTLRHTVKLGTGLINNKFSLDGRLSKIQSDGYIDRASSDLKSYYLSGAYYLPKSTIRATIFSGQEKTYQAWYGTPESRITGDSAAMEAYAERNGLSVEERDNLFTSGRTYNYYTYKNETDNYQQDHYQLHYNTRLKNISFNLSGHYTRGRGYFEQYRKNDRFSTYGFTPIVNEGSAVTFDDAFLVSGNDTIYNSNPGQDTTVVLGGSTINRTDLIRRRWLDNHFYGMVYALNYKKGKLDVTWGGGANIYDGDHFGEVIWARYAAESEIGQRYYDNNGTKKEAHTYAKATYTADKWILFADMQYRYISYDFLGFDDVSNNYQEITQQVNYHFFNPKLGAMYQHNEANRLYGSMSVGNREPVRNDLRESSPDSRPLHETLYNVEVGHQWRKRNWRVNSNVYLMEYKNQLILTGQINDVGAYNRTNVPVSYRRGIEMEAAYRLGHKWMIGANANLSRNKIAEFNEYIDNYDTWEQEVIVHQNTDMAFSPNCIVGGVVSFLPSSNWEVSLLPKYVSRQYLDNTQNLNRSMAGYFVTHLRTNYSLINVIGKEVRVGILVNNLFNKLYENNGYTFSYIYGGETITENFYYPQAGRNFMVNVTLKF